MHLRNKNNGSEKTNLFHLRKFFSSQSGIFVLVKMGFWSLFDKQSNFISQIWMKNFPGFSQKNVLYRLENLSNLL